MTSFMNNETHCIQAKQTPYDDPLGAFLATRNISVEYLGFSNNNLYPCVISQNVGSIQLMILCLNQCF